MNYKENLLTILGICLLSSFGLKPAFESYALFQKDGQKVLILGDIHASSQPPESPLARLDAQDSKIIFSFIKNIASLSEPTKFIVEASESDLKLKENLRKLCSHKDLYYELPYYARMNNYQIGQISFCLGDNRYGASRNFIEMFSLLDNNSFRVPEIFYSIKDKVKLLLGESGTINDYFKEIKIIIKQIKETIHDDSFSEITEFLKNILDQALEYKKTGKRSFTNEELETSYVDVFASRFLESKDINSLTKPLYEWILPLSDNLLDGNLIIETVKSLKSYNQVILFTGNNHAIALHEFLKNYGFESICIRGLCNKNKGSAPFIGARFDRNSLSSFLSNVFSENTTQPLTNCAQCNKQNCAKKCGNCKQSYYCSIECQKRHWPTHKTDCAQKK